MASERERIFEKALINIEQMYYKEGWGLAKRAAKMLSIARKALNDYPKDGGPDL
jgi:hypothetical protein